jgi:hypothetical protein
MQACQSNQKITRNQKSSQCSKINSLQLRRHNAMGYLHY